MPKPLGKITVVCGSMFAGKSEELIRLARRALYAKRKVWSLEAVTVKVTHRRDLAAKPVDIFDRVITLAGDLDETQRARLMEIADLCPVHKLLTGGAAIMTTVG